MGFVRSKSLKLHRPAIKSRFSALLFAALTVLASLAALDSYGGSSSACDRHLAAPPSLNFKTITLAEAPKDLFYPPDEVLFRGLSLTLTDEEVEDLFHAPNSVLWSRNPDALDKKALKAQNISDLMNSIFAHTSGFAMRDSPWLSTTFDIGVATYFSFQGQGERSFIIQFNAPSHSVNLKGLTEKLRGGQNVDRREGEVLVPMGIAPENLIQILEVENRDKQAVLIKRWYRSTSGKVITESQFKNVALPFRMSVLVQ